MVSMLDRQVGELGVGAVLLEYLSEDRDVRIDQAHHQDQETDH